MESQNTYDEKSTVNAKSNLQVGNGSVLNRGAEITATNFEYGNIQINNGDVKYGARIDTRDVHTSSKSSGFTISAGINSPIKDRIKQAAGAVSQVKNGDTAGGAMEAINAATGTIKGLADNQGTRQANYVNGSVGAKGARDAMANSNFYANIGLNAGFTRSRSNTSSHTEGAAVTTLKPMNENSSITYNNVNNIMYQGTQAQGGTFIYNNVTNIQKEAVELHNSYSSSSSSRGISAGATIGYGHKIQTTGNGGSISASQSNQNTVETVYANGNFKNVNEVHNNTGSMVLNGFNQEGGKLTGNIGKVEVISRQNTSTTTGSSSGISLGISANGVPSSVNMNGSRTNGSRAFVDNQSTFIVGEGSNLHVGTLENTGAVVGKEGNSTFKIDSYIGKDIQNHDTMKTTGGSLGISTGKPRITNVGFNQDSRDKQGITRNTVAGDVEIAGAEGSTINRDLGKANEVTRDTHSSTNINVESQLIEYALNPIKFKKDLEVAILEGNGKLNLIIEKLSNEYNIENINNQISQEELIKIQKKANDGLKLNEKERQIYNFYLKTNDLYFEFIDSKLEDIKKIVDVDKINNELNDKDKLYTINEFGKKELNFENTYKYLSEYTKKNTWTVTGSDGKVYNKAEREAEEVIAAIYSLIYEEKIKNNSEFQNFRKDWVTKAIVNYYNDKLLVTNALKLDKLVDPVLEKKVDNDIAKHTKNAVNETLENYLYKNYPKGIKFENSNRDYPNITEDGKWIYPELEEPKEYSGAYSPYKNTIQMKQLYPATKRGIYYHETEHGIQTFFSTNYYQLSNKGYNDKLVDVGRWFGLNDMFIGGTESFLYFYNIRELDSMDIINSKDVAKGGLFNIIENEINNNQKEKKRK